MARQTKQEWHHHVPQRVRLIWPQVYLPYLRFANDKTKTQQANSYFLRAIFRWTVEDTSLVALQASSRRPGKLCAVLLPPSYLTEKLCGLNWRRPFSYLWHVRAAGRRRQPFQNKRLYWLHFNSGISHACEFLFILFLYLFLTDHNSNSWTWRDLCWKTLIRFFYNP